MKLYVKLLFLVGGRWVGGSEKTKLMLYSTLVEIEIEVIVELGNNNNNNINDNDNNLLPLPPLPPNPLV